MGFSQPTGTVFPSQVVASLGGLFSALQLPPPDQPEPNQHFVALFLALALFLILVWALVSKKCCYRKGPR